LLLRSGFRVYFILIIMSVILEQWFSNFVKRKLPEFRRVLWAKNFENLSSSKTVLELREHHGPTNWKSWKQALGSLCGSGRVWWKMENCILSLALSGQVFWLPQFQNFWLWGAPQTEPDEVLLRDMLQRFRNLITFPKLVHLSRYSNGNPEK
jgi:hypothetical protein